MGTSAGTAGNQVLALQRNAARAAILDAARRLADRGVDTSSLSLSAVADEAGFVAATVYGYFRSKEELLLAIAADDLAGLAALMRRARGLDVQSLDVQSDESVEDEFDDAASELESSVGEKIEAAVMNPATPSDGRVEPKFSAPASESPVPDDTGPSITVVQDNPEPVASNVVRPDFTDDRPRVDAWLERRLRVFERALADLESRMTKAEARSSNVDQKSDDSVRSVQDRLSVFEDQFNTLRQSLTQRMDEAERRQRSLASELRADVNDASGRLDRLESAKPAGIVAPTPVSAEPQPAPVEGKAAEPEASAPVVFGRGKSPEQDGYVVAARRVATAAATLAELHAPEEPVDGENEKSPWQRFAERRVRLSARQKAVLGSATLILFVTGGTMAFEAGISDGRKVVVAVAAPVHALAPKLQRHAVHRAAPTTYASLPSRATPLDRLSALASAGNPRAELLIGLKYLHGEDVTADPSRAAQWFAKAAEGHEPLAQYWLGSMYERGEGVEKNPAEAIKWYEAAAGQGNWKAMHSLGVAYAEGNGVNKDLFEAARWFERAATLGYVNSQFNLAVLYERGDGVPQSLRDAYKWYVVAAAQGDTESRTRVEALKLQLSPADLEEGDREAQAFHPGPADREANIPPAIADLAGSSVGR